METHEHLEGNNATNIDSCLCAKRHELSNLFSYKYTVPCGKGGVVLGADTRTSTGDYVANRASRKISKVTVTVW